jgi:hypothetical protein
MVDVSDVSQEAVNEITRSKKIIETMPDLSSLNKDFSTLESMQSMQKINLILRNGF